jgi:hypothetical protein
MFRYLLAMFRFLLARNVLHSEERKSPFRVRMLENKMKIG